MTKRTKTQQADKRIQIGFRVSERDHKRIESQRVSRGMSMQDLILTALELYFQMPKDKDSWASAEIVHVKVSEDEKGSRSEQTSWMFLWSKYVNKMPREKVLLMAEVMKIDLQLLKSSRRKFPAPSSGAQT